MATRIKICGITRQEDADAVMQAGADALGLNFVAASPRRVDLARARAISTQVAGTLTRVGVFVDPTPDEVTRVLDTVELDALQFHGAESGDECRRFGVPFIKALRVRGPLAIDELGLEYRGACCLLLDAYVDGVPGGTGRSFDWSLWPGGSELPLMLAGGLTPENVGEAVRRLDPWGVDVSGGVEGARRGEKDADRIRRFVEEVNRAGS
ncbi:MAG TPA: phosphoribosylanthranilate isomerase [Pseudomonadales bacterium]